MLQGYSTRPSSAFELSSTSSPSAAATVTIQNWTTSYKWIKVVWELVGTGLAAIVSFRLNNDAAANYNRRHLTAAAVASFAAQTEIFISLLSTADGSSGSMIIPIVARGTNNLHPIQISEGLIVGQNQQVSGGYNSASNITRIDFFTDAGGMTGTINVYGLV